ncbi:HAMP domain-containing sensor histidine kinase [Clostridium sp. E02]|uniref:sensor histidine kinase n=1 Tax=Clostridium sp. E02 TaxID=2487134 RepID=UPI000F549CD9|nr:HAMP domain-containing sensor histidine kinase [Clostridium sp. E02]
MGKPTTIKRQITVFLVRTGLSMAAVIVFWFIVTQILAAIGVLIPPNYAETYIKYNTKNLMNVNEISESILPPGVSFGVYSYENRYLYGNMEKEERELASTVVTKRYSNLMGDNMYYLINREQDMCVIKYGYKPILLFGKFEFFHYNLLSMGFILSFCTISYLYELNRMTKQWFYCFHSIENLTETIRNKELELTCAKTNIKEFDQVIHSMQDMSRCLKDSLQNQWTMEQTRNQQIASLAHDVKIPLTIIKGNAELLKLADTEKERQEYTQSILMGESRIEHYIEHILKLSRLDQLSKFNKKEVSAGGWFCSLVRDAKGLAKVYDLNIEYSSPETEFNLYMDPAFLTSAMLNIIMNACEHSPEKSSVFLDGKVDGEFVLKIRDSGPGFSEEARKNATTLFYMEDKSRGNWNHYGIGMTMANQIIAAHRGTLTIFNTRDSHGCVTVRLPISIG